MAQSRFHPQYIENAPLRYAPTNEMGVVFLFSQLCRKLQLYIETIQSGFPDCIARQRIGGKERTIRIEFEFRSSNYRAHKHPLDGCDWIVCWEHDWTDVPSNLTVIELRQYFGHVFNVWTLVLPPHDDWPREGKYGFVKRVSKGDLVLIYEWSPRMWIQNIYTVVSHAEPALKDRRYGRRSYNYCKYHIIPLESVFKSLFRVPGGVTSGRSC